MQIGSYSFTHICKLSPELDAGKIRAFRPQSSYANRACLEIHSYGDGPFCKFKIDRHYKVSGVYALTIEDELKYLGECRNLSSRYNSGYGQISPRNCFVGGQRTNCRINNLIYKEFLVGKRVDLWFMETVYHKAIEKELLLALRHWPQWNLRH